MAAQLLQEPNCLRCQGGKPDKLKVETEASLAQPVLGKAECQMRPAPASRELPPEMQPTLVEAQGFQNVHDSVPLQLLRLHAPKTLEGPTVLSPMPQLQPWGRVGSLMPSAFAVQPRWCIWIRSDLALPKRWKALEHGLRGALASLARPGEAGNFPQPSHGFAAPTPRAWPQPPVVAAAAASLVPETAL